MAEIRKWNNLTSDILKEGQRLWVSTPKTTVIDKATLLPSKNPTEETKSTEIVAPKEGTNPEGLKKTIETGIAELIDVPDNSGKYLALHKSAPIGTLVLVKNLANNQSIWVKVIGRLPNADSKLIIKLSPKAFERLNAVDKRIRAEISYLVQ
jgi:LysM repeat protein